MVMQALKSPHNFTITPPIYKEKKEMHKKHYHNTNPMGLKHHSHKSYSFPHLFFFKSSTIITVILIIATVYLFLPIGRLPNQLNRVDQVRFSGDLRDGKIPWNKLCFGPGLEKLKLAVYSKSWPVGPNPGGMERHAFTLFTALARKGHEIHVFTVPSDHRPHEDIQEGNLHVHFTANDVGILNNTLALEILVRESKFGAFDYVHTESVSLPHWRAKTVPNDVAVTWHGVWYEIMHSRLFLELLSDNVNFQEPAVTELHDVMPRLVQEIKFFAKYTQHICISKSAGEILVNIYQLPKRNVHVILNGVDQTRFVHNPKSGKEFRRKHQIPDNVSLVMGVAGRLVKDKGHPLLYEAFSSITKRHPSVFLLVAGSGPWAKRYLELGPSVKVLGALEPGELSQFYNAIDVFVNPTMRPQGLDLTLIEAMHCGKTVVTPNYPSITGTVVLNDEFGYTFSPNSNSIVEALENVIRDGREVLERKGMTCKEYVRSMFTADKMASSYERFFLCMKNDRYCRYPLPTDC